jgi:hypothetical protein
MAVFLFLMASLGGVVVGDLVLENPAAGEAAVFYQPVSGYRQGVLLAMAATLGSARARPARRNKLRAIRAGTQRQAAAPEREQAGLLEWFGRHAPLGDPDQPVR